MAILIANIGTSDLAVKIDIGGGESYYFPVGFDRNEPNIDDSKLDENEKTAWDRNTRQSFITESLCKELDVKVINERFLFRELTEKLVQAYHRDPITWHSRICPGRMWGVINKAKELNVTKTVLFVTNQPDTEKQRATDSLYLFEIIKKWFETESPDTTIESEVIKFRAIDQDKLLDFYHKFFSDKIKRDETVLISVKGGTPQMQNALKVQAITSGPSNQIFIDPLLSIKTILSRKPSECQLTSYWRYMRNQKYQTVRLLMQTRWDFDGARQILKDWKDILTFLIKNQIIDSQIVSQSRIKIGQIIQALDLGMYLLNLDNHAAWIILDGNNALRTAIGLQNYSRDDLNFLNLLNQCRIYWEIDQIANFLTRLSTFYELTGEEDIPKLNFWVLQRNNIIHMDRTQGISKDRMKTWLEEERNRGYKMAKSACEPNKIIDELKLVYNRRFSSRNAEFNLYNEIRTWCIDQLEEDSRL